MTFFLHGPNKEFTRTLFWALHRRNSMILSFLILQKQKPSSKELMIKNNVPIILLLHNNIYTLDTRRWKSYNPVKQKSAIVSQKYGGGYRFLLADEDVDIAYIKSKATELFFPNQGKCYFHEDINEYEVQLNDSTGNISEDRLILKNYLKEKIDSICPRCM